MFATKKTLVASLLLSAAVIGAKTAQAEGFKFNGGSGNGGNGKSSFKVNWGSNTSSQNQHKNGSIYHAKKYSSCHNDNYHHDHYGHHHHVRYVAPRLVYSKCYHPVFRSCYVLPGDTWYTISQRIYGVDFMCRHIASYNGLSMSSPLMPGQTLQLPVINANGSLAASTAPMPQPFVPPVGAIAPPSAMRGSQAMSAGMPSGSLLPASAAPAASIRPISAEPAVPQVAIGSALELDGRSLGVEKGLVRLELNGLALPVEVIEWTAETVKVQLPKLELSRPVRASLEVLRADGSVASKSAIELTPAATRVALSN